MICCFYSYYSKIFTIQYCRCFNKAMELGCWAPDGPLYDKLTIGKMRMNLYRIYMPKIDKAIFIKSIWSIWTKF